MEQAKNVKGLFFFQEFIVKRRTLIIGLTKFLMDRFIVYLQQKFPFAAN